MDINWGAIALVFLVGLAASVVVVGATSLGIRFGAVGAAERSEDDQRSGGTTERQNPRPAGATAASGVFFAIAAAAVLYGLYLVIPQFH